MNKKAILPDINYTTWDMISGNPLRLGILLGHYSETCQRDYFAEGCPGP